MIKTKLDWYQEEALARALPFDGFLLFMEQRTGKTLTSLAIVDKRKPKHLWIVCPINAIQVWLDQIKEHLHVDWDCQLLIMNHEELRSRVKRKKYYDRMRKIGPDCFLIGDELHKGMRRRGTGVSRSLRHIAKMARWRLGLTGTPMDKVTAELWPQFDFADPTVFGKFDSKIDDETGEIIHRGFKDRYLIMGGWKNLKVIGTRNEERFFKRVQEHSYRITLREARGKDKPLKLRFAREMFDLDDATREIYEALEEDLEAEVNKKKVKVKVVVALTMKLQQLCGGFVKTEEGPEVVGSEKLRKLLKLVRKLKEQRKKFVVVCRFLYEIDRICARLKSRGITTQVVSGGRKYNHRFVEDGIIIQIQSGVAVDMSAADYILVYSGDYSHINAEQMRFRVLNRTKPFASFHYLLARDTIDEVIYAAYTGKRDFVSLVLDKYRRRPTSGKARTNSQRRIQRPLERAR